MQNKTILDACCGSRMFYFDKNSPDVLFADIRSESHEVMDRADLRTIDVRPDLIIDFREMPFEDCKFKTVIFDPPHLTTLGKNSWMFKKYGNLQKDWRQDLAKGFSECFRVLEIGGTLVFKWNETQITVSEILKLTDQKPLLGHKSGKQQNTHWILFIKK